MSATGSRALPWQEETWQRLEDSFVQARQAHALLLEGVPGTGRNRLAHAFAARLLCATPTPEGACGHCKACELFDAGSHADFLRLEPLEEGKGIGIDAIRAAIAFVATTASLGERKVLCVTPLERMSRAAFNAFLKCLEEPPPGTVVLLVNALGHPIPATIRSRCQRWVLSPPTPAQARDWLRQATQEDADTKNRTEALLALDPQRPLAALALLETGGGEALAGLTATLERLGQAAPGTSEDLHRVLETAAAGVDAETLLYVAERFLMGVARTLPATDLRGARGRQVFPGLDEIHTLRAARQAGSNPSPELLRHRVVTALAHAMP